jgi:hypothetical protein
VRENSQKPRRGIVQEVQETGQIAKVTIGPMEAFLGVKEAGLGSVPVE